MQKYKLNGETIDSVELKALCISRGIKVSNKVYKEMGKNYRVYPDPLKCNCMILPDGTIVQMTDLQFHFKYLKSALSWDSIKQVKYFSQMNTPFSLDLDDSGKPTLYYNKEIVTEVSFPESTQFYKQKTSSGLPFLGNAVIQGRQWLAFQCLWPCDYACAGQSCEFCYFGGVFENLAKRKKPLPKIPTPMDVAEIVYYAVIETGYCDSIQITGGSTFNHDKERELIESYLQAINKMVGRENIKGEILLYITPPKTPDGVDNYFKLGADRIACSIEVWDEKLATIITPGKINITTRQRHLDVLEFIAEKYGPNKAFSNFIIGLEPYESLMEGAEYLASKGIIPTASVWIPFGRPVMGSMKAPDLEFFRNVKQGFAELYKKYGLEPAGASGINVCIERDIWRYVNNT